jgi:hypothetical protein
VDGCRLAEREVRERRRQRGDAELGIGVAELSPRADVRHFGRRDDGDTPGPRDTAAEPHATMRPEENVDARLDVHLIRAQRPIVHRPAGVADHLGAYAVDGRRGECPGHDAVGDLKLLVRQICRTARRDLGVREVVLNVGGEP